MLTLLQTAASPFARKVRMVAIERGVPLALEEAKVDPADRNTALGAFNPLAKIPVLLTSKGAIYDSRVICRYIDAKGEGPGLYAGPDPWGILRLEALADGIMDAAVVARYELAIRPGDLVWQDWVAAQFARIEAALDGLEAGTEDLRTLHMGTIGLAAALEYLDFRHPKLRWREWRPGLAKWLEREVATNRMQSTKYPAF
ncbi:glutathione S-transferase family protein [Chelativorans xinjiangense]|uniref:glutathione S-transferase family protein n=1 Tax=Chelativorans xinjiangense TaxID=2681485 RepID=UPI0019162DDB|nr:glutathione S-transferase family protein [Chelativorans xinjiangense]